MTALYVLVAFAALWIGFCVLGALARIADAVEQQNAMWRESLTPQEPESLKAAA